MHKCFKCGTEFEGKFCPECGTQWLETKNCPQCGAALAGSAKFCNNCGYSFVESAEAKRKKQPSKIGIFFKKVWAWIRAHLKVIIPTACSLVVAIVICSLIPTFIAMGVNGTYYAYSFDEKGEIVYSEKDYITLSSGKWKDSDGNKGTYSRSGKNVTLTYRDQAAEDLGDIMGDLGVEVPKEIKLKATVVNGVMTVTDGTREETYATKSHKHKYGKWEVTKEPTCTLQGEQKHSCACKKFETEAVAPKGHTLNDDYVCTVCGRQFTKGLEYEYLSELNGYAVAGIGTATENNIVIPDNYNRKPVIAIKFPAFYRCTGLTSITIPNSVTSIGDYTFYGCSGLTSITIPNSVTSIGDRAFCDCTGLTSVTIPNSVTNIGDYTFYGCSGLTSITIPNCVTSIGDYAFSYCIELTSVTIPNSVTSIGDSAFKDCSRLTSIYYAGDVASWCGISGLDNLMRRDQTLYIDGKELTGDLVIPNGVTSIGYGAFYDCSGLTSVTIGNSVTSIGDFAFGDCTGLTNITLPNSVTSIGDYAFRGCSGLTSITIPNSVTSIGGSAFRGCSGLTSITIPNSVTSIGWSAFRDCYSLTSITIPNSVISIGSYAFYDCSRLTSVTIPNSVTSIGDYAFYDCTGLTSIQFNGTKAQWKKIKKDYFWDYLTGNYTIQCTDGKLPK